MTTPTTTNATNGAAPAGTAPTHAEAPAAASVKVLDPDGREWILTLRTTTAAADAPTCPTHGCAMKQGRRGWYCPTKILDDDGTGRPVYCKATR